MQTSTVWKAISFGAAAVILIGVVFFIHESRVGRLSPEERTAVESLRKEIETLDRGDFLVMKDGGVCAVIFKVRDIQVKFSCSVTSPGDERVINNLLALEVSEIVRTGDEKWAETAKKFFQ